MNSVFVCTASNGRYISLYDEPTNQVTIRMHASQNADYDTWFTYECPFQPWQATVCMHIESWERNTKAMDVIMAEKRDTGYKHFYDIQEALGRPLFCTEWNESNGKGGSFVVLVATKPLEIC